MMKFQKSRPYMLGLLLLGVNCALSEAAKAAACSFQVNSVLVGTNNLVTIYTNDVATSTPKTFSNICSLNADYSVPVQTTPATSVIVKPDTCRAIYSGLITARYSNTPVLLYLYDVTTCNTPTTTPVQIGAANDPYNYRF
jgi:hypothetical protein